MVKYKILFGIWLCCFTVYGQKKTLTQSEAKLFKQQVEASAASLKTLESNFIQIKHLDFVTNDIRSSGKLYFKAPGLIRWEYTAPFSYQVIFNNEKMYINDGGRKKDIEISSSKMLKDLSKILVGTVQGTHIFDEDKFNITYFRSGADYLSAFTPKDKVIAKYVKQIELTFDGTTKLVRNVRITEPSLDYTLIQFHDQQKNKAISNEKFSAP